jgi:hypothetical protein
VPTAEERSATAETMPTIVARGLAGVQWGPIVAGAFGAAALGFVLNGFAISIGLSVSSTAPTCRDASFYLALLSGLYLLLASIAAYGFGGYLAARMRVSGGGSGAPVETEFRDGIHGLITWALGTVMAVLIAVVVVAGLSRLSAPSSGATGASTSLGAENIIAADLDRLFRTERSSESNISYDRAVAGRILLSTTSHQGLQNDDRDYLVRLVAARTGLARPDAEKRVDEVIARAKENITRARRSAVLLAFMTSAAALAGAAMAWFAAQAGGRHRDGQIAPHFLLTWDAVPRRT